MSTEKNLKKSQKPTYEIKETPLLKKIFNKILGPYQILLVEKRIFLGLFFLVFKTQLNNTF